MKLVHLYSPLKYHVAILNHTGGPDKIAIIDANYNIKYIAKVFSLLGKYQKNVCFMNSEGRSLRVLPWGSGWEMINFELRRVFNEI